MEKKTHFLMDVIIHHISLYFVYKNSTSINNNTVKHNINLSIL